MIKGTVQPNPRRRRRARGQSLVEFALVLPIFLLLLFGVIDAGRLVYLHTVLSQAAREGARLTSVEASWLAQGHPSCGTAGGPVCPANATVLKADVLTATNRMISPFAAITTSQLYVRCDPSGGAPTGSWTGSSCSSNTTGSIASVRLESTFTPITPVLSGLIGTLTMSASSSMVIN
ncbi:MAG: TadE/TadG family type IV pilus assembly protein [Candidatus Limnocylindrales bacterium]